MDHRCRSPHMLKRILAFSLVSICLALNACDEEPETRFERAAWLADTSNGTSRIVSTERAVVKATLLSSDYRASLEVEDSDTSKSKRAILRDQFSSTMAFRVTVERKGD